MQAHASLILSVATLSGLCLSANAADARPSNAPTATPVLKFLASLGVVTKTDQNYDYRNYIPALRYLGVRNIRDGVSEVQKLIALYSRPASKRTSWMAPISRACSPPAAPWPRPEPC